MRGYPQGILDFCKLRLRGRAAPDFEDVAVFDEAAGENKYVPLYEVGSSKLARKTHVDLMNKVQVNMYAAGLHRVGSKAVKRYTMMELKDRFEFACYFSAH